jgi:hypothetical protein
MKDNKGTVPLVVVQDAPPPGLAVAAAVLIAALAISAFPSLESVDAVAKPKVFTKRLYPSYLILPTLLHIRTAFALLCFAVMSYESFLSPGHVCCYFELATVTIVHTVECIHHSPPPCIAAVKLTQRIYHSPNCNETGFMSRAFASYSVTPLHMLEHMLACT